MEEFSHNDRFENVLLETFREFGVGISRPRVRALDERLRSLGVSFPRALREEHPISTRFRADVTYTQQSGKAPYLRTDNKSISVEREFRLNFIEWAIVRPGSASGRSYLAYPVNALTRNM
jgi:uncharacterized protein YllA (UPF0747 family)